jgi:hypothetical protein
MRCSLFHTKHQTAVSQHSTALFGFEHSIYFKKTVNIRHNQVKMPYYFGSKIRKHIDFVTKTVYNKAVHI